MLLFVLALITTTVLAQEPKPCESPRQFEGRIATIDKGKGFSRYIRLSYDEDNMRVREDEEEDLYWRKEHYDIIYLYNENKEYHYNYVTKKCTVQSITRPFMPLAVPRDAKFQGEFSIGASGNPDEHLTAVLFEGEYKSNPYAIAATSPSCYPIEVDFFSKRTLGVHTTFYDITIGIHDPSVFIPRPECEGI